MLRDRVSIIMITRNRGNQIRTALEHLLELPEQPHIIVVDNGSTDETVNVARRVHSSIEVVPLGRNLGGAGRNVGVALARSPYVAFSDDDSWWEAGALSRAAQLFDSQPRLGLVAARILVGPEEQLDPMCAVMANSPLASDGQDGSAEIGVPIVSFVACGAIVRKSAFVEAGGFDAHFGIGGEEEVLALDLLRRGWRLAYVAAITAYHHPSSVRNVARRQRHQIRNALWSLWLRRPARSALISTWHIVASAMGERPCRLGLVEALAGLQWVVRARRPVPLAIDRQVRKAESAFYSEHGRPPAAYSDSG
jgi:GT2 family glycosyltransferase